MKEIKVEREDMGNNETLVSRGVFQNNDGSYTWLTYSLSGNCKRLSTAMRKAGFEK